MAVTPRVLPDCHTFTESLSDYFTGLNGLGVFYWEGTLSIDCSSPPFA